MRKINDKSKSFFITRSIPTVCLMVGMSLCMLKGHTQKGEFGLRYMPTIPAMKLTNANGVQITDGGSFSFGAGAELGYNFTNHVGVIGEVIYSDLSQKYSETDVERKVELKYVNIPLLLSLNTNISKAVNFNIVGGPQLGLNVGSSLITTGGQSTSNAILSVKKADLGFAYGAGLNFGLNPSHTIRADLGFRGVVGVLDIGKNNDNTTTNSYYILDRSHVTTYAGYAGLSFLF